MLDLQQAKALAQGTILYCSYRNNADGTPSRAKVTSVKTWKRSPDRVLIGLKHGLYTYFKIDESMIDEWTTEEEEVA